MSTSSPVGPGTSAVERLVASGAGASGVAAGGVIGYLIGDGAGALAGGASGALLQDGVKAAVGEVAERLTTRMERERVGACLLLAHEEITERLNGGESLREAGFFQRRERQRQKALRSEAEELLEGAFLAARDSYEERKVELLARFYASAAFTSGIDSSHLNHLLSLSKLLTYRQLVIIGAIGSRDLSAVRASDYRGGQQIAAKTIGVLYEVYQMVGLDLITSSDSSYILGLADINPSLLKLQGNGAHLYNLMRLWDTPAEDQLHFFEAFAP